MRQLVFNPKGNKIMQKGMEMNLIVAMILAIIGVGLFIALINGDIRNAATSIYCKTFLKSF